MKIGAIEVLPVLDGVGKEQAAQVLTRPGVPDAWACHADSLDEHGTLHLDLGGCPARAHAADWAHFVDPPHADPGAVRKLRPLVDRLETFETDGAIAPGLSARH